MSALLRQIMADTPTNFWPMQEPSGSTVEDVVGTADATAAGTFTRNAPMGPLRGLSLDGTTGRVPLPSFGAVGNVSWTIEMWYMPAAPNAGGMLLNWRDSVNINGQAAVYTNASGFGYGTDGNEDFTLAGGAEPTVDVVHQLVVVRTAALVTAYIDAAVASTDNTVNAKSYQQKVGGIGYDRRNFDLSVAASFFKGVVAYGALWASSALTANDVKRHYQAGIRAGVVVG